MTEKTRKWKRRSLWNVENEHLLIKLWEKNIDGFRGSRKNSHIHKEISGILKTQGYEIEATDVRIKLDNLQKKYRDELKKIALSGGKPSSWEYFKRVHTILASYKTIELINIMPESTEVWLDSTEWKNEDIEDVEDIESICSLDSATKNSNQVRDSDEESFSDGSSLFKRRKNKGFESRMIRIAEEELEVNKKKIKLLEDIAEENKNFHKKLLDLLETKSF